ncbi:MAG: DMT family transporter [Pontibacterium sp.]
MMINTLSANTRGGLFMCFSMAGFAVEDMLIKAAAQSVSLGVLLMLFGVGGMVLFSLLAWMKGEQVFNAAYFSKGQWVRSSFELVGRLFFALAITLSPLSSASAILQATPLVVVLGGVLFLGEQVRWQHWLAMAAGFVGVLLIVRPGLDSFTMVSLFAVISTVGFAGRDLATRAAPPSLSNFQLGINGFAVLVLSGLVLQFGFPEQSEQALPVGASFGLTLSQGVLVVAIVVSGVLGYNCLTKAMRTGEVAMVTPFRYTRLLFAIILGVVVFNERPDALTLLGGAIIVASGVLVLWKGPTWVKAA